MKWIFLFLAVFAGAAHSKTKLNNTWDARAIKAKKRLEALEHSNQLNPNDLCIWIVEKAYSLILDEKLRAKVSRQGQEKENYTLVLAVPKTTTEAPTDLPLTNVQYSYYKGSEKPDGLGLVGLQDGWAMSIPKDAPGKMLVTDNKFCAFLFSLSDPLNPSVLALPK